MDGVQKKKPWKFLRQTSTTPVSVPSRTQILFTITHLALSRLQQRLFLAFLASRSSVSRSCSYPASVFLIAGAMGCRCKLLPRPGRANVATGWQRAGTLRFLIAPKYPQSCGGKAAHNFSIFLLYQFSLRRLFRRSWESSRGAALVQQDVSSY